MTAECDAAVRAAQKESEKLGILPAAGQGQCRKHVRRRLRRRALAPRRAARAGIGRETRLMPTMNMIQALNDAHKVMMRARRRHRRVRRGHRLFRRRLPRDRGTAEGVRQDPRLRRADQRGRDRRDRGRHGRLWPQAGHRDPVRRLHLSRLRPDRQRSREDALPHRRRVDDADGHPHALRRRHLRRPDAQPVAGKPVHPHRRPEGRRSRRRPTTRRAC